MDGDPPAGVRVRPNSRENPVSEPAVVCLRWVDMAAALSSMLPTDATRASGDPAWPVPDLVRGDPAALDWLVRNHRDRVAALAYRLLGWSDEVDDVVQDVFVSALSNLHRFRGDCSVATWLNTITVNTCRNRWRTRLLRGRFFKPRAESDEPRAVEAAGRPTMPRESFDSVRAAVRALPARYREVVVLRYLAEMPVSEISSVLELKPNAVQVRLKRARERLRRALKDLIRD